MPYIKQSDRKFIDAVLNLLFDVLRLLSSNDPDGDNGRMNYVITRLINAWYGSGGYNAFNDAVGVLECVKQEFYRRVVAPYEDKKKEERGDVY